MGAPAAAQGPAAPNLTAPLAAWLRRMGFTAMEYAGGWTDTVQASWYTEAGHRFQVEYVYARATTGLGTFRLWFYPASSRMPDALVADITVRRLKQARYLLTQNHAYALHRATALAAGTLVHT